MSEPRELVESISDLFTLPDLYFRIRTLVEDPDAGLQDVAREISLDPGLTARLLRIANSPLFGCVARVETVERAINLLGMQQVYYLVLATSVSGAFGEGPDEFVPMQEFWSNSVFCGTAANLLGSRCNVIDSDKLFVEGLLCNIGHLVMYQCIPKQTYQARLFAEREGSPVWENERELIGFDYAEVGSELLAYWQLPESLCEAVRFQNDPASAPEYPLETAIAHIATRCGYAEDNDAQWEISPESLGITGLSLEDIARAASEARELTAEVTGLVITRQAA